MSVLDLITENTRHSRATLFAIIDPDKHDLRTLGSLSKLLQSSGLDGLMLGGTFLYSDTCSEAIHRIKQNTSLPLILFPGGSGMALEVTPEADAILFLTLLSGRNPEYLISEQVRAGIRVKQAKLECLPVGYMLVRTPATRSIESLTGTIALPITNPPLGALHAIAAECLGCKLVYFDCGSNSPTTLPLDYVTQVRKSIDIPLMVSGGIRTSDTIASLRTAGANVLAVGSVLESAEGVEKAVRPLVQAAHAPTDSV